MSYILYLSTDFDLVKSPKKLKFINFYLATHQIPNNDFKITRLDFSFPTVYRIIRTESSDIDIRAWSRDIEFSGPINWANEDIQNDSYQASMELFDLIVYINSFGFKVELIMKWWNEDLENTDYEDFNLKSISREDFFVYTNYKMRFIN